ncbi:DUF6053 domain-containing protein [Lysobacter enzymogenes]|uniref:DUF6053 domain-containing protein n=1 Tax=Lysobacter enzymogenes TaxID=69 RepID=UPI00384FCFD9
MAVGGFGFVGTGSVGPESPPTRVFASAQGSARGRREGIRVGETSAPTLFARYAATGNKSVGTEVPP